MANGKGGVGIVWVTKRGGRMRACFIVSHSVLCLCGQRHFDGGKLWLTVWIWSNGPAKSLQLLCSLVPPRHTELDSTTPCLAYLRQNLLPKQKILVLGNNTT
ncbi:unnamed protein product [Miscanthus lutarioriparius]|uniref:Uncharacterized protein n=1 Tax=Miscanthus lutarioriparius TaxID=422564 RepID=A0A811RXT0_9POAL|nr:unnamed protein product [Miscanthus lutarioriparius]